MGTGRCRNQKPHGWSKPMARCGQPLLWTSNRQVQLQSYSLFSPPLANFHSGSRVSELHAVPGFGTSQLHAGSTRVGLNLLHSPHAQHSLAYNWHSIECHELPGLVLTPNLKGTQDASLVLWNMSEWGYGGSSGSSHFNSLWLCLHWLSHQVCPSLCLVGTWYSCTSWSSCF